MMSSEISLTTINIDDPLKSQLVNIGTAIVGIYQSRVAKAPPLGAKSITLFQGVPCPRAFIPIIPQNYLIRIHLSSHSFVQEQFVWQFAHEMGHIYQWPSEEARIRETKKPGAKLEFNNFLTESFCTAMSYICLSFMGSTFSLYRWIQIIDNLKKLEIGFDGNLTMEVMARIESELPFWIETCSENDRPQQGAAALLIEDELLKHLGTWGALCYLGDATRDFKTDFNQWMRLVKPEQNLLVDALVKKFRP